MKVFLTGATGYIGEQLLRRLVADGHTVHALCRSVSRAQLRFGDVPVTWVEGDLDNKAQLELGMRGCDAVFHVAGYARVWHRDSSTFTRINVMGTENVLDAAQAAGVPRVVVTSTAGVIGPSIHGPVNEDSRRAVPFETDYERTKSEAEDLVRRRAAQGMHVVIVNPTRVYGPGLISESNAMTLLIDRYRRRTWRILPGNGKRIGNYVYVDDVVQGHLLALEKGRAGARYLLGGENASYIQLFETLSQVCGHKLPLWRVPVTVMKIFAHLQMLRARLLGKDPLITPAFVRKYLYDWEVDITRSRTELGYNPVSLQEGIRRTVAWLNTTKKT